MKKESWCPKCKWWVASSAYRAHRKMCEGSRTKWCGRCNTGVPIEEFDLHNKVCRMISYSLMYGMTAAQAQKVLRGDDAIVTEVIEGLTNKSDNVTFSIERPTPRNFIETLLANEESMQNLTQAQVGQRYHLDQLWFDKKKGIVPIESLTTPHLRNIVKLYTNNPAKYEEYENDPTLRDRVAYAKHVLEQREVSVKRQVHDMKIRLEGIVKQISYPYSGLNVNELANVLKQNIGLLTQVENIFNAEA